MKIQVIAEVGINHNGNLKLAKKYLIECKKIGVDIVKFQVAIPRKVVTTYAKLAKYQKNFQKKTNQLTMLNNLHLTLNEYDQLINFAKKKKVKTLFSFFDEESLAFLIKKNQKLLKIASGELDNFILLNKLKNFKGNIFLSTGMSSFKEISEVVNFLNSINIKNEQIILMHCNSSYPSPYEDINLNVLDMFKGNFNNILGYSDHSIGDIIPICAAAKGAKYIEKHITFNSNDFGPDHKASMEFFDFKQMIHKIKIVEKSLGKYLKFATKSEKSNKAIVRKSLVASKEIKMGDIFTFNNLTSKRPGNGISPKYFKKFLGKKAKKNYKPDDQI